MKCCDDEWIDDEFGMKNWGKDWKLFMKIFHELVLDFCHVMMKLR
jgi:hypothetical protein